ncbi:MAG: hypothetical protein OXN89_14955 [Bryobacterales bacterium]|nr:hypothetical protein [Bryobacterales bacterium]
MPHALGRTYRERIDLIRLAAMILTERSAERRFEPTLWQGERYCADRATART